MKQTIKTIITGFVAGLAGAFTYTHYLEVPPLTNQAEPMVQQASKDSFSQINSSSNQPLATNYRTETVMADKDFVAASSKSTTSVVYIKTVSQTRYGNSWFEYFFGDRTGQTISSGSGVIYTSDGYIITNNHVIDGADQIEVIHNKQPYPAVLVGSDPSTDIAILKIEAKKLPNITIGSSHDLQVGEWVIAVGNPFNLQSTVTAGIVSAKGREINILKSDFPIESFIQTDAAINPGNSGGALVNIDGELVGINTAILSKTGSYAGYGFAVPVDIVTKVADDMINYGEVQKAFLGADVLDMDPEIAQQLEVEELTGVVVSYIQKNGAADKAGLQKGDIILQINGEAINSRAIFEETISYYSPGDAINITYKRNGKVQQKRLTLTNRLGTTNLLKREIYASEKLGADLEVLPDEEMDMLDIDHGIRINKVKEGFVKRLGIQEGFIITSINKQPIEDPRQLENNLTNLRGRVIIEGVNKNGVKGYYSYYF
ncbi:MAG: trypsin-like peptidase domain-containing protein [Candidatus Cyclobacteriaceae bacterium M3_2C_046]